MSAAPIKVLVIDDEPPIRKLLRMGLTTQGYEILEASNGKIALEKLTEEPALIILDLGLPDIQGHELLRTIRARNEAVPIVVLSSRGDEAGKVQALDLGADDYLTKPFGTGELLARVRPLLRRGEGAQADRPASYQLDGVSIDMQAHRVTRSDGDVHLTKTEWSLLEALTAYPGKLLTHRWLLERVWGDTYGEDVEVLRVFVSQLRRKIEPDPRRPRAIVTEPGIGYRWSGEAAGDP